MRFFVLFFCFVYSSLAFGQLNEARKKKIDSLLIVAQTKTLPNETRFNAYASITKTIYTNVAYGMEICEKYLAFVRSVNDTNHIIAALHFVGFGEKSKGNLMLSKKYYEEGLHLAKLKEKPFKICNALANVGNIHLAMGNIDSAYFYHKESVVLARSKGFKKLQARGHINLGEVYRIQGNYLKSIENLDSAVSICEKEKFYAYFATTYTEIGNVNLAVKEFETARNYYNKALESATKNKFYGSMANANIKLAELAIAQQQWNEATVFYNKAETLCIEKNLPLIHIKVKRGIGALQLMINEPQNALVSLKESLGMMEELGVQFEAEITYHLLGKTLFGLANYSESNIYLKKAYKAAKKYNNKELMPICFSLYQLNNKLNNSSAALKFYEEYIHLKTTLEDEEALKKIIKLEYERNYTQKQFQDSLINANEKERLSLAHQQETQKQKRRTYIVLSALVVVLCILILLFIFWRNKQKHNKQLIEKNKAIEQALHDKNILLKEVNHRVKNNMQIVSSLLHFQSRNTDNETVKNTLNETQLRLQSIQLVHQKIYDTENFEQVNLTNYTKDLVRVLSNSIVPKDCSIEVVGDAISTHVEQVQAVGFIIHELITNSVKYAWNNEQNKNIRLSITINNNDEIELTYCDNGKGIKEPLVFEEISSFGLKLIYALVKRQLIGTINYLKNEYSCFTIKFKKR